MRRRGGAVECERGRADAADGAEAADETEDDEDDVVRVDTMDE